jgi:hypothetical protein
VAHSAEVEFHSEFESIFKTALNLASMDQLGTFGENTLDKISHATFPLIDPPKDISPPLLNCSKCTHVGTHMSQIKSTSVLSTWKMSPLKVYSPTEHIISLRITSEQIMSERLNTERITS